MPSSPEGNPGGTAVCDLVMPKLGLTMTEGVLAEWHVKPGDRVRPGQVIFVVETDKIANEVEAPGAGEIVEILVGSGESVAVGTPLARWTGTGVLREESQSQAPRTDGEGAPDPRRAQRDPVAQTVNHVPEQV